MAKDTRLQKMLAECGIASRRKAEEMIAAGRVAVNGVRAQIGDKVDVKKDKVTVDGQRVQTVDEKVYIMVHKPRGYLTSMSDDRGRKCVSELVADVGSRVYPIGRLDLNSEGLLLLTDDGELANLLTHPRHAVSKLYNVSVRGELSEKQLEILRSPLVIDGYRTRGAEVEVIERHEGGGKLKITLYEGRNRQIRKMCEQAGLSVSRLCRVQIGEIKLDGLALGKWRYLDRAQVKYLKSLKNKAN